MSDLLSQLQRLEEAFRAQGALTLKFASPGLSEDQIATTLAGIGLPAPDEVLTWWGWRNGSVRDGSWQHRQGASIGPFLQPTLAESIAYRAKQRTQEMELGNSPEQVDLIWHRSWLLLAGRREALAVLVEEGASTCPVLTADPYGTVDSATSVTEAVAVWVRALEERWWSWDDSAGLWRYNDEKIPEKINARQIA